MDWENLAVALSAVAGGILYAMFGWMESGEPWDTRRFGKSVAAAVVAGTGFGVAYIFAGEISIRDLLIAFLAGMGVTATGPKILGTAKG